MVLRESDHFYRLIVVLICIRNYKSQFPFVGIRPPLRGSSACLSVETVSLPSLNKWLRRAISLESAAKRSNKGHVGRRKSNGLINTQEGRTWRGDLMENQKAFQSEWKWLEEKSVSKGPMENGRKVGKLQLLHHVIVMVVVREKINAFSYQVMKARLHQISISLQNTMLQ